jgi:hypothetical protein
LRQNQRCIPRFAWERSRLGRNSFTAKELSGKMSFDAGETLNAAYFLKPKSVSYSLIATAPGLFFPGTPASRRVDGVLRELRENPVAAPSLTEPDKWLSQHPALQHSFRLDFT